MILKKSVHPEKIGELMKFLGPDGTQNDVWPEEVHHPPLDKGKTLVFMQDGEGSLCARPFCRLVSCKSYYSENDGHIYFGVVIEIPDKVSVAVMTEGDDPTEVKGEGIPWPVNQGNILSKLNELLKDDYSPWDIKPREI